MPPHTTASMALGFRNGKAVAGKLLRAYTKWSTNKFRGGETLANCRFQEARVQSQYVDAPR
jgi:hypothetical protein